jgi:hypothetical protein
MIVSRTEEDKENNYKKFDANGHLLKEIKLVKSVNGYKSYEVRDSTETRQIVEIQSDSTYDYKEFDKNGIELSRTFKKIKNKLPIEEYFYKNGEPTWVTKYIYKYFD